MVFSGMVAATPNQGGAIWAVMQYVLGFRELGWDVWFVEPAPLASAAYCESVMTQFDLADRWALVDGADTAGLSRAGLLEVAARADVLVNVSGMLTDNEILDHIDTRVYLDLDPAFVQLWHAIEGIDMRFDAHTHFVTLSDRVGADGSVIPDCGRRWTAILPPVVLSHWPVADRVDHPSLTTIGNWRGYGSIDVDGVRFGQKAHSMRGLMEVAARLPVPVELAMGIHPDEATDLAALHENGWRLIDPAAVAGTPSDYQAFIAGSWAEFGVAKSGYVLSDSGWFSDRSAAYLASGRPVVAQETGFSRRLPVGQGLFAFSDADEVVSAVVDLTLDYEKHRHAARGIAEEHLDSRAVLRRLLDEVLG